MERNNLKAVIFDLDGVITDSAKYHYLAWKELADELGIPFDEEYNEKLKGVSRMESLDLILANGRGRVWSEEEKVRMAEKKNDNYKELIKQITPADLLPGIEEFLRELRDNGIRIALASVSKNAPFILHQLELEEYFDYVADAAKVEHAKPFPDIFLAGMNAFGLRPEECVGIEDARTGIEAIHRAGMKAVGVGTPSEMEEADFITDTAHLRLDVVRRIVD
jgi:beta-phosphoglucomutase